MGLIGFLRFFTFLMMAVVITGIALVSYILALLAVIVGV